MWGSRMNSYSPTERPHFFLPSIKGAVDIVNQGLEFLLAISDSDYLTRAKAARHKFYYRAYRSPRSISSTAGF